MWLSSLEKNDICGYHYIIKFYIPGSYHSFQYIRLSLAQIHMFSTGQTYASSNVFLYSGICKPKRTGRGKQMASKRGREEKW